MIEERKLQKFYPSTRKPETPIFRPQTLNPKPRFPIFNLQSSILNHQFHRFPLLEFPTHFRIDGARASRWHHPPLQVDGEFQ
jgi:hypothetical protein